VRPPVGAPESDYANSPMFSSVNIVTAHFVCPRVISVKIILFLLYIVSVK